MELNGSMLATSAYRRAAALALIGIALGAFPTVFVGAGEVQPWRIEMTRMLGILVIGVALLIPWVGREGGRVAFRFRLWMTAGIAAALLYLLSGSPLFLILAFCCASGGALSSWMERAHVASQRLWEAVRAEEKRNRRHDR